jgi:undecaprenyl-diphosphatase
VEHSYWHAVWIGIVEGLTEFLPVSSTAHIRITQELLGQDSEDPYGKMFAVVIQLGAILAVLVYFRKRLADFVRSFFQPSQGSASRWKHPLALVLLSFVVTAIPCFVIDKKIGEQLENLPAMAWALILGGIAMAVVDAYASRRSTVHRLEDVNTKAAVGIGLFQILAAAFPGTSRSMVTIAGGQLFGLDRSTALEFSFFLSIPVMMAASGFKLLQFVLDDHNAQRMDSQGIGVLAVGFVVSFLVAWGVIAWFMQWVRRQGFLPFAIYRIVAGIALLGWLANRVSH